MEYFSDIYNLSNCYDCAFNILELSSKKNVYEWTCHLCNKTYCTACKSPYIYFSSGEPKIYNEYEDVSEEDISNDEYISLTTRKENIASFNYYVDSDYSGLYKSYDYLSICKSCIRDCSDPYSFVNSLKCSNDFKKCKKMIITKPQTSSINIPEELSIIVSVENSEFMESFKYIYISYGKNIYSHEPNQGVYLGKIEFIDCGDIDDDEEIVEDYPTLQSLIEEIRMENQLF